MRMQEILILKIVVRFIIPFIQVYGFYVITAGHLSPGGGFAGGTIVAASMVLYALTFDASQGLEKLSHERASLFESLGAIWYVALGLLGVLVGGNFLTNGQIGIPLGTPGYLISGGLIPLLSFGIGIKVAVTVVSLYYSLVEED